VSSQAASHDFARIKETVSKKVLENGLTIISARVGRIPKVLVQIAYDVGSAVEEEGEKGLAHLVEHMIFKGTDEKLQEGAIDGIARKYGASFNAFTSTDETSYYFEVDRANWHHFLPILSDCMQNCTFDSEHLASEVKAVIQELNMYRDRHTSRMVEQALHVAFPPNHPYHHPVIGYKEDLASLTAEGLKAFYKKYYHPERAVLFIVGDIDPDEAIKRAEEEFKAIPGGTSQPPRQFPTHLPEFISHTISIYEQVQREKVALFWTIPGIIDKAGPIVDMISSVLGGGEGSRLYRRLIDELQIAEDIGAHGYQMMNGGLFLVLVEPKEGQQQACLDAINQVMQEFLESGAEHDELERVCARERSRFVLTLESLNSTVYEWIESYFATRNEYAIFDRLDQIESITDQDVLKFSRTYLQGYMAGKVELLPMSDLQREQWPALQEQHKMIEQKILQVHNRTTPISEPALPESFTKPNPLSFSFPRPQISKTLSNKLFVNYLHDDVLPLCSLNMQFRDSPYFAGSLKGRLVSLMMGTLIEGSTSHSKKELVDFLDGYGVYYRLDNVGAHFTVTADAFEAVSERFFDILLNPAFDNAAVEKMKDLFIATLERSKDSAKDIGFRLFKNLVYKGTDCEWSVDDAIEAVRSFGRDEMVQLHRRVVTPESVIMSLVGPLSDSQVEALYSMLESKWHASSSPYQPLLVGERSFKPDQVVTHQMMRDQVFMIMGRPSEVNMTDDDYLPLKMLNLIAFYSLGSRLYEIREQTGMFYNASGALAAGAGREPGQDSVYAIVNPDKVDEAERLISDMLVTLARDGVSEDEVDAARQMILNQYIDMVSTTGYVASYFSSLEVYGLSQDYYDLSLKRINTMNAAQLSEVAARYFSPEGMVKIRVGNLK
jgi:zinc protease